MVLWILRNEYGVRVWKNLWPCRSLPLESRGLSSGLHDENQLSRTAGPRVRGNTSFQKSPAPATSLQEPVQRREPLCSWQQQWCPWNITWIKALFSPLPEGSCEPPYILSSSWVREGDGVDALRDCSKDTESSKRHS